MSDRIVSAAVVVIGNEILSGRTADRNLPFLATRLNELGIQLREARVVPDLEDEIVRAVNETRARHDYVFTTGGIGPTHDDITGDAIAKAFAVGIDYHAEAVAILKAHYANTGAELNTARLRMARVPAGAELIDNPVSKAPGYQIGNVFVLAGVPAIMQAMFESLKHKLVGGLPVRSLAIAAYLAEGAIAKGLGELAGRHPEVDLGSYPFYRQGRFGTSIVGRSTDPDRLAAAAAELRQLMRDLGAEPLEESTNSPG
ncbi:MAG: competence/damage-inducible protein A [Alphaproteobacteria bacterium]|nr:competence/damage-inducible protein A [Alphaproteobacteria bacterium]